MSEVYLTKIERKTIFTKSLIFVLIMFIISDLTVTGPFWFNFVPWIYILGTVGSLKKIDSVLMCVISTFTVFVASVIVGGGISLNAFLSPLITLVVLILGIITGKLLFQFVLEHRLVKYIKPSKKTMYIISIIAMFIASLVIVGLHDGNVITYLNSRKSLTQHITSTYDIQDFAVISTKYNSKVAGKYVYVVELEGQEVYFVPVTKGTFKDANKDQRLEALNTKLEQETRQTIEQFVNNYALLNGAQVQYSLEYTQPGVIPNTVLLSINCVQEENLEELYEQLSNYIKDCISYKQATKVVIVINGQSLEINENNIQSITADYIKGGFEIEELSE